MGPPESDNRRHSYGGQASQKVGASGASSSKPDLHDQGKKKGFMSKLKDKAIGTKEERAEDKRRNAEVRLSSSWNHKSSS